MPSLWRRTSPYVLTVAVALGVAVAPGTPATAAVPNSPGPAIVINGSGWGHSVGMSQYGARVMAQRGHSFDGILRHYYPGTAVGPDSRVDDGKTVSIDLFAKRAGLEGRNGVDLRAIGAHSPTGALTSQVLLDMPGTPDRPGTRHTVPSNGSLMWVGHDPARREYVLHLDGREIAAAPNDRPVRVWQENAGSNPGILKLHQLANSNPYTGTFYGGGPRGGALEISSPETSPGVRGSTATSPVLVQPMGTYLLGIAEMPSSWEPAALQAQATTARTYAGRFLGTTISATPVHQAYAGWSKEREPGFGHRWVDAVRRTSGQAVTYQGGLAQTYYSSSHGLGRTEASEDSWAYGATIPYLRSVDDPFSAGGGNPHNSWRAVATNEAFAAVMGLAKVSNVRITSRTAGGSPKTLQVDGWTPSGERLSCTWSGGEPCTANQTGAKGAGARMRTGLPVVEGGASNGRIRSQQIASITVAPFTDDEDSVHQYNIAAVSAAGITSGCGPALYCPNGQVARGQMATLLAKSLGLQPDNGSDAFTDIAGSPHRGYINALARAGRIGGYPDGRYGPGDPVRREQIATFLVKAFDVPPAPGQDRFDDIASSPHRDNINAAAARGIAGGCTASSYCPGGTMSRGQLATFLARAKGLGE